MIETFGYLRVSTLEQAREDRISIDMQKSAINECAVRNGWAKPSHFYIDTASGESLKLRPEIMRLLEEVRTKKIKRLVFYKQDRLSRSAYDSEFIFSVFDENNVEYRSATEPYVTSVKSSDSIFFRQLNASFAQREQSVRKDRLLGGRYAKVERDGSNFGSLPPYGYALDNQRFVIVEEEAEVVRKIYQLYVQFRSRRRVRDELKRQGIKAKILLDDRQVGRILHNPKYVGRMRVKGKVYAKRHPPIVSDDLFARVQDISRENNLNHVINWSIVAPGYFLRDVARCGHCGHQMCRVETPRIKQGCEGETLKYYSCSLRKKRSNRKPHNDCSHRTSHVKEEIEGRVLQAILQHIETLLNDEDYLSSHLNITTKEHIRDLRKKIDGTTESIETKRRAKARLLDALEKTEDPDIVKRLERNSQDIKSLEENVDHLTAELSREKSKVEDFKTQHSFFKDFKDNWQEANDQEKRDLINTLIRRLDISKDGTFKITYIF